MSRFLVTVICSFFFFCTYGQQADKPLQISQLEGDFYIYTTYSVYKGELYPANGMYLITSEGALILDSPWDTTQFQPLLDSILLRHGKKTILCIATHFHEDRTSGLEYFKQKGIKTYTTTMTDSLSKQAGMKRAEYILKKDSSFKLGEYSFDLYYPGHGHAPDNIVIWFGKQKILYGGCLIKSTDDASLGNLGDANTKEYPKTLRRVLTKFGSAKHIIPGHNSWKNKNSLRHSLRMAEQLAP